MQQSLFSNSIEPSKNLLPFGGIVHYFGLVFGPDEANYLSRSLLEDIQWENDKAVVFGKVIETKRKVAWYADEAFPYRYSGTTKTALPWNTDLLKIKHQIEKVTLTKYNSCLLNLYHDGSEGMAWHSDGEKELRREGSIASVSLGAERKFSFKHKETKERIDLLLEHGSLMEMKGATQMNWLHRLPPTKKVHDYRINLTFRQIGN